MLGEGYRKCIICGEIFKRTKMRTCTCSVECAQEWVNRRKEERKNRIYPQIECANRIPDEKDKNIFHCKITGYLCRPTERKPYERFHCLFEPKYLGNERVQRTVKIIKSIKQGTLVSYIVQMKGDGYLKYKSAGQTMRIKEIFPNGEIILEAAVDREKYQGIEPRTEKRTIHDFYDVLHVDDETFKKAMEAAVDEHEEENWMEKEIYE